MAHYSKRKIGWIGAWLCLAFVLGGCAARSGSQIGASLAAIQLFDRNGVQETISQPERVQGYTENDFLASQPYEKVVRTYEKRQDGSSLSKMTTYHTNGHVWQYLETINGRAKGRYTEWYPTGQKRMETTVIEGIGDLLPQAQTSWVFDGISHVWDMDGNLIAEIRYCKGLLEGESVYYHDSGVISKILPYKNDKLEGSVRLYDKEGELIGHSEYTHGEKNGKSIFAGNASVPKREELFKEGKLIWGKYWDFQGKLFSEVINGRGMRPLFEKGRLVEKRIFVGGVPEGRVELYQESGALANSYYIMNGKKDGEEWIYYDSLDGDMPLRPKLQVHWKDDQIDGTVRTWYEDGTLESEKEITNHKKNGTLIAWYRDGSLMMVEEYENDRLNNGKYLKPEESQPVSRVIQGNGVATIYNAEGKFVRKVEYEEGVPKG